MSIRQILHVDLDAFFASVEQLDFPSYRGKPVIVGGLPGDRRSVVSTASYEARKFGVHSAMPTAKAYQLCPQGIYVRGRMDRYCQISRQIMDIFKEFSPDVQQMSIDEAFIDLTGTEKLFGSPETTARRIKERVLQETGLTVSVGLAANKYLAKIASGMDKPDGLYVIPPGGEERFMLSLPLEKLWGIGNKTRKLLNDRGFYTIEEIHRASLAGLTQLFGDSTGMFLYQAVRGQEAAGFDDEPKSRSISNESTYSFDLTDRDVILTALLDLCYTVYFRLLSDGFCSRTVHLKIRYEDFTTVSIQETLPRYISSTDDFYERIVHLFDVKYDRSMGIRLLGVGCQNLETGVSGAQQELFDFGEGKKRAVETAVLELQKKDPKNLVKKARQFLSCVLLAVCVSFFPGHQAAAEEPDVTLYSEGYWESTLTSTASFTFQKDRPADVHLTPVVYSQKADLTLWFLFRNHWYFEAGFADDLADYTVAAGYTGDAAVREIRMGNRGITFQSHPALEAFGYHTGNENLHAPGIMASFGGDRWNFDTMVRFEQIESCSQTWQGDSKAITVTRELNDWVRNRYFILPDRDIVQHIVALWVQSADGTMRRLSDSQYLLIPGTGQIQIAENVITGSGQSVLAELDSTGISKITASWPALISDVDDSFEDFPINDYYYQYDAATPAFYGTSYLYLQKDGYFSPFMDSSRYRYAVEGTTPSAAVVSAVTGTVDSRYTLTMYEEEKQYLQVVPNRILQDADSRYPFAGSMPELYIPGHATHTAATTGKLIQIQSWTESTAYNIGTKALSETVIVRKNGTPVTARYDAATGNITLDSSPGPFDVITVSWNEPSETAGNPVLHTAAGAGIQLSDTLYADAATSVMWPWITETAYSTPDSPQTGSAVIAAYTDWNTGNDRQAFSLSSATGVTFSVPDVTGVLRIEGFDESSSAALLLNEQSLQQPDNVQVSIQTSRAQQPRSGTEVTASWNQGDRLVLPLTFSSGSTRIPNAQVVHLWLKGTLSANCSVTLEGGHDFRFSEDLTANLQNDAWTRYSFVLSEKDRHILAESNQYRLVIASPDGTDTSGSITLAGDTTALSGITFSGTAAGYSSAQIETAVPPAPLPASVTWLSAREPLRAARFMLKGKGTLVSETLLPAMNLSSYEKLQYLLLIETQPAPTVTVTVDLISDEGMVLVSMESPASNNIQSQGSWITVTHVLTAAEKAALQETPPAKRRITITSDQNPATDVTLWYDELTAMGITDNDLLLRNVSTARYEREKVLFFTDTVLQAEADTSLSPADSWNGGATGSLSAGTTVPFLHLSAGAGYRLTSDTGSVDHVTYTLQSDQTKPLAQYVSGFSRYQTDFSAGKTARRDTLSLSVPLKSLNSLLQTGMTADYSNNRTDWQQKADMFTQIRIGEQHPVTFRMAGTFQQQVPESTGSDWILTAKEEFSAGEADAGKRSETVTGTVSSVLPWFSLEPTLLLEAGNLFTTVTDTASQALRSRLTVPFTAAGHHFSVFYAKETTLQDTPATAAVSYTTDMLALDPILTIPFSVSPQSDSLIQTQLSPRAVYGLKETTGVTWKRPSFYNALDLVIPVKAEAEYGTTNRYSAITRTDSLYGKGTITFTALNCLGSDSATPLFTFYTQDETITTVSVQYTDLQWSTRVFTSETLFFASGAQFNMTSTAEWKEDSGITVQETLSLQHQSEKVDGVSAFSHEEECAFLYSTKETRLQVLHRTTSAVKNALSLSGTIQSWWNHTDTADTIGCTAAASIRLSY